jgi:hypothetical protein
VRGKPVKKAGRAAAKPARKAASKPRAKTVPKAKAAKPAPRKAAVRAKAKAPAKTQRPPKAEAAQLERRFRTPPASLDRARRTLADDGVPTPPSSLDMNRQASAARTGRAELAEDQQEHQTMTPAITGGDVDANVETAYFSGDEAPGGDNPTPDQDIVDDIGRALGVQYQDNEELQSGDKVAERDRHRWELDPASSEDYRDRK